LRNLRHAVEAYKVLQKLLSFFFFRSIFAHRHNTHAHTRFDLQKKTPELEMRCPIAEFIMTDTVIFCSCHNCWLIYSKQDCCSPSLEQDEQFTIIHIHQNIITQNWNQFLLVVKATTLKQQISTFYHQIQRTDIAITFVSVSGLS